MSVLSDSGDALAEHLLCPAVSLALALIRVSFFQKRAYIKA